ncbi:MAG: hypothetical protein ACOYVF_06105 [Candidatus Zixiibacteriota bacterium]
MLYLDYSKLSDFINRFYGSAEQKAARLVGRDREFDSGYFDIVRFFGPDRVDPAHIEIKYVEGVFEFSDELIARFAGEVEAEMRRKKRLFDGPTVMMMTAFDINADPPMITVREVRYGDIAGSGYALDMKHQLFESRGGSLREYYKSKYPGPAYEDSPLPNCIGVCGYLLLREKDESYLLQVQRSGQVASLENSPGPSAAGGVDFVRGYRNLEELLLKSLYNEIIEELNLKEGECRITPLACAREIFRGERPQVFALMETSLSREVVAFRLKNSRPDFEEIAGFDFYEFPFRSAVRRDRLGRLNHEARMNYYLLEEYLTGSGE